MAKFARILLEAGDSKLESALPNTAAITTMDSDFAKRGLQIEAFKAD